MTQLTIGRIRKDTQETQESAQNINVRKIPALQLARELGLEFPEDGLPLVMDDGMTYAVKADDPVSSNATFMTDSTGQMLLVQQMMGG